jgi:hypothetical protein
MSRKRENTPVVSLIDNRSASTSSSTSSAFKVCPLKDPCNTDNETRQFLVVSNDPTTMTTMPSNDDKSTSAHSSIYEVQGLSHPKSFEYSSFFVSNRVISNKDLHVVTPVDPLYFLLTHFTEEEKWQPWDQLVQSKSIPQIVLKGIEQDKTQLKHFFVMNDSYGDDLILYKFKQGLALNWLNKKMDRIQTFLIQQMNILQEKERIEQSKNIGAFSSSFHLPPRAEQTRENETTDTSSLSSSTASVPKHDILLSPNDTLALTKSAAQIICEYLSPFWQKKLLVHLQLSEMDLHPVKKASEVVHIDSIAPTCSPTSHAVTPPSSSSSASQKRSLQQINISEADKLLQYTMGESSASGDKDKETEAKKKKLEAKTTALKRLEKVNTKGMKSMMSFFGGATKK